MNQNQHYQEDSTRELEDLETEQKLHWIKADGTNLKGALRILLDGEKQLH
jgi:hypothetical protein